MFTKYPQPGEIWEYTGVTTVVGTPLWIIVEEDGRDKTGRQIMRLDGVYRTLYHFTNKHLKDWRRRA